MKIYKPLNEYFRLTASIDNPDPKLRDPKALFTELAKAPRINSRLLGHYITRTTALSSFGWDIQPISPLPPGRKVTPDRSLSSPALAGRIEVTAVKERNSDAINFLITSHCNTPFYGASLYKLDFRNTTEGTAISVTQKILNQDFDFDSGYIHFYSDGRYSYTLSSSEAADKLFLLDVFNHDLKGGILRAIMPLEIIRFDMILENANYLRKLKGILQIINKGGASSDSQSAAESAAQNAVSNNFFISDDLIELKLNEIAGQGGQNFRDFIDMINNDMAIAVLGQANTSELPANGGSRAALQVMRLISQDIFYADMTRIENLINRFLLFDYRLNADKTALNTPYKFRFIIEEEQDIEKNAAALEAVNRVLPVKKEEAYRFVNFTPPAPDDDILPIKQSQW